MPYLTGSTPLSLLPTRIVRFAIQQGWTSNNSGNFTVLSNAAIAGTTTPVVSIWIGLDRARGQLSFSLSNGFNTIFPDSAQPLDSLRRFGRHYTWHHPSRSGTYHVVVNSRRVACIWRSTYDYGFYAGLMDNVPALSSYRFPALVGTVGGTAAATAGTTPPTGPYIRSFVDPFEFRTTSGGLPQRETSLVGCNPEGIWHRIISGRITAGEGSIALSRESKILTTPYGINDGGQEAAATPEYGSDARASTAPLVNWNLSVLPGTTARFPVLPINIIDGNADQYWGDMDGFFWVPDSVPLDSTFVLDGATHRVFSIAERGFSGYSIASHSGARKFAMRLS